MCWTHGKFTLPHERGGAGFSAVPRNDLPDTPKLQRLPDGAGACRHIDQGQPVGLRAMAMGIRAAVVRHARKGRLLINARSETTIAEKPAFRAACPRAGRCLIISQRFL